MSDNLDITNLDEKILSRGYKGLDSAVSNIKSLVDILDSVGVDTADIKSDFSDILKIKKDLSERNLNFIKDNTQYKNIVKKWVYDKKRPADKKQFLSFVNDHLNKSIREVKMQSAILRRQREKNVIQRYFIKNIDSVITIINIIYKLQQIEQKIQKHF